MSDFGGFSADAFAWFRGLERDNSRAYFTSTRDVYEREVRGALQAMFEALQAELGGEIKLFRQNRDVRFSPDKSPYKTNTYGVIDGRWYASISAEGLYAGTGYHQLARDQLERFRAAVADAGSGPELETAVGAARAAGLEVLGRMLKTAPRGYDRDHPRVGLLQHKLLIAGRELPPDGGIDRDAALQHVASTWHAARPLNAWLDAHVGPTTEPLRLRPGRAGS
jgi:uncharacterized protein (TIGR02453 family)